MSLSELAQVKIAERLETLETENTKLRAMKTPTTDVKLYELADARLVIDTALEASDGELTPDLAVALDRWEADFAAKVEAVACYIDEQERIAKVRTEAAKHLIASSQTLTHRAESLREYLKHQLERVQQTSVKGKLKDVRIRLNPPQVVALVDFTQDDLKALHLNDECQRFVGHQENWSVDKVAVRDALKADALPSALRPAFQLQQDTRLEIK